MKKKIARPNRRRPATTLDAYQISPARGETRLYFGRLDKGRQSIVSYDPLQGHKAMITYIS